MLSTIQQAWDWFTRQPYLVLTLTTLIWGANAVAGRLAVGHVSPMGLTTFRWLVAVVAIWAVSRTTIRAEWRRLVPTWPRIFVMGALGFTIFNALFYWAAHHTSAVNIGVVQGVTPAIVMAMTFLVYRTPISPLQFVGLIATLVGVVVIASRGEFAVLAGLDFNIGDLGVFLASILYAGYTVGLRTRPAVSPFTLFAALAAAAFLSSLPLLAVEIATGRFQVPTARGWALIAFVGLVPSLVAQILFIRAVEMIGPGRAGLFMNLIPVFAAFLGVVILGELFAPYHAAALLFVIGGIGLAEYGRRR